MGMSARKDWWKPSAAEAERSFSMPEHTCDRYYNVQTGEFCPMCVAAERDALRTELAQANQARQEEVRELVEAAQHLADWAAGVVTEPNRFARNEHEIQQTLGAAVASVRLVLARLESQQQPSQEETERLGQQLEQMDDEKPGILPYGDSQIGGDG
jgi:hypothetical protein